MMEIAILWDNISRGGEKPFLLSPQGIVSYEDLRALVCSACASLRKQRIPAGQRVGILLENEAQASAVLAAALLEGLVPVMLPFGIGKPRLSAIERAIEPACIVDDPSIFLSEASLPGPFPNVNGDSLAYLLFTSGTTAAPSGVEITRDNLCSHLETLIRLFGFDQNTRIFNPTPIAHTDGLIFGPLLTMATGGTMIRPGPMRLSELHSWVDMARIHAATHMMTNPTVLSIIDRAADRTDCFSFAGFQGILCGGSNLRPELWHRFETRFHTQIWNLYGLTETVTTALYAGRHPEMGAVGTLGKPIDCEARLAPSESGTPGFQQEDVGELQLRGPHIFRGYWKNPERTAATFLPGGWMRTGDIVRRNQDGSFAFLGRVKTAINSGGTLIRGEEIDECLLRHFAVAEVVTVGLPDDQFEEIAVSAVVLGAPADEAELLRHCRTELEVLKVPKRILIVPEIPRGDAGKPKIQAVKDMLASRVHATPAYVNAESDDIGKQLLSLAGLVFGVEPDALSADSSPDTVDGWDSFRHVNLILQAENTFDVRIPGELIGKVGTLGELIDLVKNLKSRRLDAEHLAIGQATDS